MTNNRWRNWPIDKWQQLDSALAERGVQTVIGALQPKPWGSRQQLGAFSSRYFVGKESPEYLVGLLSRMDCIVSNDSGLAHVGGALGVPTIAICGGKYDGHAAFGWYDSVQVLQAPSRRIDDVPLCETLDTIEATLFKQCDRKARPWR